MSVMEDIIQNLPLAVLVFDHQGKFIYGNDAACRLFNLNPHQAYGETCSQLLPDLPNILYPNNQGGSSECCLKDLASGKICYNRRGQKLFCRSLPLPGDPSGQYRQLLLVEDMHDHCNLAGRVLEEERLIGVTEISNTLAHKLNQYLQVIMGYVSLLTLELTPEHPCYSYLNKILEQLENIRLTTHKLSNIHHYAVIERPDGRRMFDLDEATAEGTSLHLR